MSMNSAVKKKPAESLELSRVSKHSANSWRWYISPQMWLRKIVSLEDTPHSIALGTSVGVFVALTPTVGIQMIIVLVIAWLVKSLMPFNRVAGLIAVYLSNPVTTVPIYWFNYWVGTFFIEGNVTRQDLVDALEYTSFSEWWSSIGRLLFEFGWPLVLGSLLVGLACAIPTYPVTKWLAEAMQRKRRLLQLRRERKLAQRAAKREKNEASKCSESPELG